MKTSLKSDSRLDCKAALGILTICSDVDYELNSFWDEKGFFHIENDESDFVPDFARFLWERLYSEGDNKDIMYSVKRLQEGENVYTFLEKIGNKSYYKIAKLTAGSKVRSIHSTWMCSAGMNVGRSDFPVLQKDVVKEYYSLGIEQFEKDVRSLLHNDISILNTGRKNPTIKIGAEDDAVKSGGPTIGFSKNSAHTVHPLRFILAMESLIHLGITNVSTVNDDGETTTTYYHKLETKTKIGSITPENTPLYAPNMESDIHIFPLWETSQPAKTIIEELEKEKYRTNKGNTKVNEIIRVVLESDVFARVSLFTTTSLDSNNNINYYIGERMYIGENPLSIIDENLSVPTIQRHTKHVNLDSYLRSNWAAIKRNTTNPVKNSYLNLTYAKSATRKETVENYKEPTINVIRNYIDDGSVEFSIALTLRKLIVENDSKGTKEKIHFTDTCLDGENILDKAVTTEMKVCSRNFSMSGMKALQYNIPIVDIAKVENFYTQLWIIHDGFLNILLSDDYYVNNLCKRKPKHEGKEYSLNAYELKGGWKLEEQ